MFWRRGYTLRGEVGGGWALEFPSFLGPVKWHRADRRVPFGAPPPIAASLILTAKLMIYIENPAKIPVWQKIRQSIPLLI
jgi:hypothetical protein